MTDSSVGKKKSGTITCSCCYIREAVFWGAGPRTLTDSRHRLGGNRCVQLPDTRRPAHQTTQRYTPEVHNLNTQCHKNLAWLGWLVAGLPLLWLGPDPRPGHVRFMVDEVAVGRFCKH